ncbi:hypothetical protein FS837_007934 [Tulasnella sp. UAMH 9824]|nr:hypothetical protein FS837_007934 [Tulasnella sp. UAMH 9824]
MPKGNVIVSGHADRTPEQKLKHSFPVSEPWTQPFMKLLNGATEEMFLRAREQLNLIFDVMGEAKQINSTHSSVQHAELNGHSVSTLALEDLAKVGQLGAALEKKTDLPGTKAQLKPTFHRVKPPVVGGVFGRGTISLDGDWQPPHAARYQSILVSTLDKISLSSVGNGMLQNVQILLVPNIR